MPARAKTTNTGVSVGKVKPVLDLVRGMYVGDALDMLSVMPSPVAARVAKVVKSASANAEAEMLGSASNLRIVETFANEATTLRRFRARARGRVARIKKRSSDITVVIDEGTPDGK